MFPYAIQNPSRSSEACKLFFKHNNMKVVAKMSLLPGSLLSLKHISFRAPPEISQCSTRNITWSVKRIGCHSEMERTDCSECISSACSTIIYMFKDYVRKLLEVTGDKREHSKAWAEIIPIITTAAYWKLFTKHIYIVQLLFITNKANL